MTSPVRGRAGVAGRGEDDGDRVVVAPAQRPDLVEPADRRRLQQLAERRLQPGEDHLGLGVAEPRVELDHPRSAGGEGQPDVQDAGERRAAAAHLVDRRLRDAGDDVVDQPGRGPVQRRVGAHAAGVGAGVAVADPLEVLRRRQRDDVLTVGEAEQRHLGAVEELLDHDLRPGRQAPLRVRQGLGPVAR